MITTFIISSFFHFRLSILLLAFTLLLLFLLSSRLSPARTQLRSRPLRRILPLRQTSLYFTSLRLTLLHIPLLYFALLHFPSPPFPRPIISRSSHPILPLSTPPALTAACMKQPPSSRLPTPSFSFVYYHLPANACLRLRRSAHQSSRHPNPEASCSALTSLLSPKSRFFVE